MLKTLVLRILSSGGNAMGKPVTIYNAEALAVVDSATLAQVASAQAAIIYNYYRKA